MANIESFTFPFDPFVRARMFRHARCYAPEAAMRVLRDVIATPRVVLAIDIDALQRSVLASVDRVTQLALDALSYAEVQIVLIARTHLELAAVLQPRIHRAWCLNAWEPAPSLRCRFPDDPLVAISDDPDIHSALRPTDRGIALGRPDLVRNNIAEAAAVSVRATLWWMFAERIQPHSVCANDTVDEALHSKHSV